MGNLPVSGQLERVARSARVAGIITVVIGILFVAAIGLTVLAATDAGGYVRTPVLIVRVIMMAVLYLVPGALLWWLGRRLDAGALWAFVPILVVVAVSCSVIVFSRGLSYLVVGVLLRLPMVYVVAMWLNGFSEYRDFRRQRRPRRRRFDVALVTNSPTPVAAPPPPVRMPPRPRR